MVSLVLTVIGPDRVGIVQSLSEAISAHGGNWVESRMAQLGGKFAGLLRVDVGPDRADALALTLSALHGLSVVIERAESGGPDQSEREVVLDLMGADHPGIVAEVAAALAGQAVNVQELNTECVPAPMTGEPLFQATATLRVPPSVSTDDLRDALEAVAEDLMVDLSLDG